VISSTLSILFRSCHWKQSLFICVRRSIKYSGNAANADPELITDSILASKDKEE